MASAEQAALDFPVEPSAARKQRTPAGRSRSTPRPAAEPGQLTYIPPVLTPELAIEQARRVLVDAGLMAQVSRVVAWPTSNRAGWLSTVALLRVGADPAKVADALAVLPGAEVRCGEVMVAAYRPIATAR